MTTYTDHADALFNTGKPILGAVHLEARDNLIATAEGSSDAPVMASAWHPYDMVNVGDGATGVIWDHAVDGNTDPIVTPTFSVDFDYLIVLDGLSVNLSANMGVDLYKGTSGVWAAAISGIALGTSEVSGGMYGSIILARPSASSVGHSAVVRDGIATLASGSVTTLVAPYGRAGIATNATRQIVTAARLGLDGASVFDGGKVRLYRRRSHEGA